MTDLELLIKRALKARGIKATQIGDLGFNYMTFYRKMKNYMAKRNLTIQRLLIRSI